MQKVYVKLASMLITQHSSTLTGVIITPTKEMGIALQQVQSMYKHGQETQMEAFLDNQVMLG